MQNAGVSAERAGRNSEAASLAALAEVRNGVITGEGPTTEGRIHYSRCIDATDTALVKQILLAGGEAAISRAEAEVLFDIHDAALEHADGGAFEALFARAIAHHVLAVAGRPVPARSAALTETAPVSDWVSDAGALQGETAAWLASRLQRRRRGLGALAALAALLGIAAPWGASVAALIDFAA